MVQGAEKYGSQWSSHLLTLITLTFFPRTALLQDYCWGVRVCMDQPDISHYSECQYCAFLTPPPLNRRWVISDHPHCRSNILSGYERKVTRESWRTKFIGKWSRIKFSDDRCLGLCATPTSVPLYGSDGDLEGWKESKSKYRFHVSPLIYSLCASGWKWFGFHFVVVKYLVKQCSWKCRHTDCFPKSLQET
jgi:hypothetical protein